MTRPFVALLSRAHGNASYAASFIPEDVYRPYFLLARRRTCISDASFLEKKVRWKCFRGSREHRAVRCFSLELSTRLHFVSAYEMLRVDFYVLVESRNNRIGELISSDVVRRIWIIFNSYSDRLISKIYPREDITPLNAVASDLESHCDDTNSWSRVWHVLRCEPLTRVFHTSRASLKLA